MPDHAAQLLRGFPGDATRLNALIDGYVIDFLLKNPGFNSLNSVGAIYKLGSYMMQDVVPVISRIPNGTLALAEPLIASGRTTPAEVAKLIGTGALAIYGENKTAYEVLRAGQAMCAEQSLVGAMMWRRLWERFPDPAVPKSPMIMGGNLGTPGRQIEGHCWLRFQSPNGTASPLNDQVLDVAKGVALPLGDYLTQFHPTFVNQGIRCVKR